MQIFIQIFKLLRELQFSLNTSQSGLGFTDTILKRLLCILIFKNHFTQKTNYLICGQLPLSGLCCFRKCSTSLIAFDTAQILFYASLPVGTVAVEITGRLFELLLKDLVILRLEYLPEYCLTFLCSRKEELQEIALCDHGNLGELTAVDSQDLLNFVPDLIVFSHHLTARERQFHSCLLGGKTLSF